MNSDPPLVENLRHLSLALIATHELDAMKQQEWLVLPLTSFLPEPIAWRAFTVLHVPIFYGLFRCASSPSMAIRSKFDRYFGGFCVFHAGLHLAFWMHKQNTFNNVMSQSIIWAAAAVGGWLVKASADASKK